MSLIKVVIKRPGEEPKIEMVENELSELQRIVGGYIEAVTGFTSETIIVCNEEGKIQQLQSNFGYGTDVIVGTAIICGVNEDDFDSLTDEQVDEVLNYFK